MIDGAGVMIEAAEGKIAMYLAGKKLVHTQLGAVLPWSQLL